MEKSKKKDKIEMDSLVESGENSVKNSPSGDDEKQNLQVPVSGQTYGSTLSIGPEASTANLLKIDLEKKISRHTGKRYLFIYVILRYVKTERGGYFLVAFLIEIGVTFSNNSFYCKMTKYSSLLKIATKWDKNFLYCIHIYICMSS